YVLAQPSTSGDLNDYGDTFGAFLAQHPPVAALPYISDVARLEWAIDEVNRAADAAIVPQRVLETLAAVAPERLPSVKLRLAARCRLVASDHPILRIWQANAPGHDGGRDIAAGAPGHDGDSRVAADAPGDTLAVRRDPDGIVVERLPACEFAWLAAL